MRASGYLPRKASAGAATKENSAASASAMDGPAAVSNLSDRRGKANAGGKSGGSSPAPAWDFCGRVARRRGSFSPARQTAL